MNGKVAVITGGARGIGATCVREFLSAGYRVAACDISAEAGAEFLAELGRPAEEVRFYAVDVTSETSVDEAFKQIVADFGSIDILVNNAGITKDGLLLRMKTEQWNQVLNVNLTGSFLCAKAAVPTMVKNRFGRIINVASVVGLMGNAGQANYCASKAGLVGFTKSLARELGSRNVTVNAVAPGFVETEMTRNLPAQVREDMLRSIPVGRFCVPEEIARTIVFLAGDAASYITGHVLNVNGGMYM